jgi:glycosyltransferase involved in cell wall biosynthesis
MGPLPGGRAGREAVRRALEQLGEPHVVMSRGESAAALEPLLPGGTCFVYEAHRPLQAVLEGHGRRWWSDPRRRLAAWRGARRERRLLARADGLVCLTSGVWDDLRQRHRVRGKPHLILPSGVDVDRLAAEGAGPAGPAGPAMEPVDVLYVGKLVARKGVDTLVRAVARMPGRTVRLIGGDEAQRAWVRRVAADCGLGVERLRLPGFVAPRDVAGCYRAARVGVCPLPTGLSAVSDRFTSPMKVLEMMAAGLPIVASDLPTVRAMLDPGVTAELVVASDPAALAVGLERLLEDPRHAARLARAARRAVRAYAWPCRAEALARFCRTVVG